MIWIHSLNCCWASRTSCLYEMSILLWNLSRYKACFVNNNWHGKHKRIHNTWDKDQISNCWDYQVFLELEFRKHDSQREMLSKSMKSSLLHWLPESRLECTHCCNCHCCWYFQILDYRWENLLQYSEWVLILQRKIFQKEKEEQMFRLNDEIGVTRRR